MSGFPPDGHEQSLGWRGIFSSAQRPVLIGLVGLIVLAWADLFRRAGVLSWSGVASLAMPRADAWSWGEGLTTFAMWAVMMVAMMLPAAMPMILLYAAIARKRSGGSGSSIRQVSLFVMGYVLVWTAFSAGATVAQWGLQATLLLSSALVITESVLSGVVVLSAGLYQFSPLKETCLSHCRAPLDFLFTRWRPGPAGAWRLGVAHGGYCLGCCWVLMLLLFVGGVMNLVWIALLSILVLLERVLPRGMRLCYVTGTALVLWGVLLIGYGASLAR